MLLFIFIIIFYLFLIIHLFSLSLSYCLDWMLLFIYFIFFPFWHFYSTWGSGTQFLPRYSCLVPGVYTFYGHLTQVTRTLPQLSKFLV
ncbi:hypothetical protein BDV29DRAFT_166242 [Aspergillus leporis]|uniref:Uncharacterized protein n=1 Tax=Aspergillus leporis TaxID=41062 RepID=A0A5N5XGP9_9EURO|nr:hypothetical protein BDV29DRAFT_166242 [Aspergillus leporis]